MLHGWFAQAALCRDPAIKHSNGSRQTLLTQHGTKAESFAEGADQNGGFLIQPMGPIRLQGQSSASWYIRLVHKRGVACVQITLP